MKKLNSSIVIKGIGLALFFVATANVANAQQIEATGGDAVYLIEVEEVPYFVHVFTNAGTANFDVTSGGQVEFLVVGGGGGGGGLLGLAHRGLAAARAA